MIELRHIISEKRSTIPDNKIKERSWIVLFRRNPDLEVLLVKDDEGDWAFPGGQLDNEETADDAAWRELKEETGVVPDKLHFVKTFYHDKEHKLKVSHVFYAEISKDIQIKNHSDVEKSKWLPANTEIDKTGFSKTKQEALDLCLHHLKDSREQIKEAMVKARTLGLPLQLLLEGKKRTMNGYLVVMEGIDGAGKSTHCRALRKLLERKGWKVTTTEWNTSPHISKAIKKGKKEKWLSPTLYSLLHASDMVWRFENVIKPALNEGHVVLCDRYHYTSYVRDQLRGVKKEVLDKIYEGFPEPDLVLHFNVPPRLAVERLLNERGFRWYSGGMDLGYSKNLEECASIYEGQMDKAYSNLLPKVKNYHKINTERSIGEIFSEVAHLVKNKLSEVKRQKLMGEETTPPSMFKTMVSEMYIHGYEMDETAQTMRVPENFDRYSEGSGWQAYRGGNDWENGTTGVAVYLNPEGYNKEMARIWFEVKYPPHLEEYVSSNKGWNTPSSKAVKKWGDKAARRWMRETVNIRRSTRKYHGIHDGYQRDWVERKPWKECFILALQSPRMKDFVKKYGIDKTKWIGMKRSGELNEGVGKPSKFWWMDPKGELISVPGSGHAQKGTEILDKQFGVPLRYLKNVYSEMYNRGYVRIGFVGYYSHYYLEVAGKNISAIQWRSLKDLAIEMGADQIYDEPNRRSIRVDESRILFENFHENKEWFIYEGDNTLTAVFEDNTRHSFKIHFHDSRLREDREKHRKRAASTWKRLATEIRKSAGINRAGNPVVIPWQECFERALKDPLMLEFVDDLRATPIFEYFQPIQNIWLAPDGKATKVGSHESGGYNILVAIGKVVPNLKGIKSIYDSLYKLGYARIITGDNAYPLIVDTGSDATPRLTRVQREWVDETSHAIGLNGEYSNAYGKTLTLEGSLNEMTYDELHRSMEDFRTRKDIRQGTKTGADSRNAGARNVNVRSLKVVSTVGRDGNEHETSMFSYKTRGGDDPRQQHQRWQGFIRFMENSGDGVVAPVKDQQDVEVNCNCPDYRYVWAKANSDVDAGVTAKDGGIKMQTQAAPGKAVNIFEAAFKGTNDNDGTYGKRIRNPQNTPGLCKHLIALAKYIERETKSEPVAPAKPGKEEPSSVAKPSKLKKTGKPVNIFESIRNFAIANPTFEVPYED